MSGYRRLAELAQQERELVTGGRLAELPALNAERQSLVESLPAQAPLEARPYLEQALAVTSGTSELLAHAAAGLRHELTTLAKHRRVANSYAGVAPAVSLDATA